MVNNTQIIGGYIVPVAESVSLTKAAFDIENPQIRKTDFSKSISIPSTAETNKLFENLFNVQVALQTFDPNIKTDYELLIDGVSILKGYCQLKEIKQTDGAITYILNASGLVGDLFRDIGESELTDLDFSDLDHTWNETNVIASWTPTLGEEYVYPMINYGAKVQQQFWSTYEFKPALFVKEYIDRIFTDAGYTYDSDFFISTRFKSLIIPSSTETILMTDSDVEDRQFYVSRLTSDQTSINGHWHDTTRMDTLIFNDDSTGDDYNTSGTDYDTLTGEWNCGFSQKYAYKGDLDMSFSYTPSSTGQQNLIQGIANNLVDAYMKIHIVRTRAAVETIVDTILIPLFSIFDGARIVSPFASGDFSFAFQTMDFDAVVGDTFEVRMGSINLIGNYGTSAALFGSDVDFTMDTGSTCGVVIRDTQISVGETMSMASTIPRNVKQRDFLNAIIKRFNLYLQFDEVDNKKIIIEPLSDFVTSDKEDLNGWVDISKEKRILPLGALKDGSFIFKDKEDKDIWNEVYQSRKPYTYGHYKFNIENDFLLNEKVIETIFSPCPLWIDLNQSDRILSSIEFPRDGKGFTTATALPKLLYWGGLLDTNFTWYLNSTTTARTTYPYAGHLDDPFDPNFDLNWGVTKMLFYDFSSGGRVDLKFTDKNCFNIYWKDYINQIANKDSKLLEIYMVLDSYRYDTLSFRKQYFIEGVYWRLLEVQDFNPLSPKTTKCLFIQLPEVETFTGEQKVIFGGEGTFTSGDEQPTKGYLTSIDGGHRQGIQNLIFGKNVSTGNQSIHNSDDVESGSGVKQVLTSGSDGSRIHAVRGGAINSPNVELYRHGDFHFNGIPQTKRFELTLTAAVMKTLNTSPIPLQIPVMSDEYIRIEKGFVEVGGTAFTNSQQLDIETITTGSTLTNSETSVFASTNFIGLMINQTEQLDFGEGLQLYQAADMTGTGSDCTITLFYQIIKL